METNNSEKVIEVQGLSKKFKDVQAVEELNINVYRGDVFGFLGPNGAGKSTTIRMLLTLVKPDYGNIKLFGENLFENRNKLLSKIGAIVEKPDFYGYLSAYKNLEILGKISGVETSKNKIMSLLELVNLHKRYKSKVKTFSHGMKQRLGLAQALLHDPELIILDEPTTGLDPQGMKEIRELIITLSKEKNKTVFLSSHILAEVELVANRMIIINKGKTMVEGEVKELLSSDQNTVTFKLNKPALALELIKSSNWCNKLVSSNEDSMVFKMTDEEAALLNKRLVENGVGVYSIVHSRSLEQYFLQITGTN